MAPKRGAAGAPVPKAAAAAPAGAALPKAGAAASPKAKPGAAPPRPKAAEGGAAWGRPPAPAGAAAKAKQAPPPADQPPRNIAAQAARNLGGFVPNKIFVGGVPISCTDDQFRGYFEPYGAISKVELHALRGFGYITYESVEAVDACLEKYEDHHLCKKWVEVKRSIPRELIDAYEREQRRLHAEHLAAAGAPAPGAPAEAPAKPEPAASPSAPGPSSSAPRRAGGGGWGSRGAPAAGGSGDLSRIAQLEAMGFSGEVARKVLAECAWDVNAAIDRLLLSGAEMSSEPAGAGAPPDEAPAPVPAAAEERAPVAEVAVAAVHVEEAEEEPQEPAPAGAAAERAPAAGASPTDAAAAEPGGAEARRSAPPPAEPRPPRAEAARGAAPAAPAAAEAPRPAPGAAPRAPKKRLERAAHAWPAEDPSQLCVRDGECVRVWTDTTTDNGWIHAELARDASQVGWLPLCVLKETEANKKLMRVREVWQITGENQCSVEVDTVVLVWMSSRTAEGWTYIEVDQDGGGTQSGWVPDFCLEWDED